MITKEKLRIPEYRTLPFNAEKGYEEKKADLIEEMRTLVEGAKAETRALTEEETAKYNQLKADIAGIDAMLKTIEEQRSFDSFVPVKKKPEEEKRTQDEINNQELFDIFTGRVTENRASGSMNTGTTTQGGHVVNKELSKQIIKTLKDRSNVYSFFNGTTVKGTLRIPKQTASGTANWKSEKTNFNGNSTASPEIPTLDILELTQHRLYRESAITQHMLNAQELNLQQFIKDDIADSMIDKIEDAIFNGTGSDQPKGIVTELKQDTTRAITLNKKDTITVKELKALKAKLKQSIVKNAKWFMTAETFLYIDQLEDSQGRPLLQPDISEGTGYRLLGLPVVLTEVLKSPGGSVAQYDCLIVLATPAGFHTNTQKAVSLYVYNDSIYTREGLVGYASDIYLDGKVKDKQQVALLLNKHD